MMQMRVFVFSALLPFLAGAQQEVVPDFTFELDSGTKMVLTGGWTERDLEVSRIAIDAPVIFKALKSISLPVGNRWIVIKQPYAGGSISCPPTTWLGTEIRTLESIVHEMALALFKPCDFLNQRNSAQEESYAKGKVALVYQMLARQGHPDFKPTSRLAWNSTSLRQEFLASSGGRGQDGSGIESHESSWFWEMVAAKLGGTLVPVDLALARYGDLARSVNEAVGQIAGRSASVWLQNMPKLFALNLSQRKALGFDVAGDPTNQLWFRSIVRGEISEWENSPTIVNPHNLYVDLMEMKDGVKNVARDLSNERARMKILDLNGKEYLSLEGKGFPLPPKGPELPGNPPWPKLVDGVYVTETSLLRDGAWDPQNVSRQYFIIDKTNWTPGKMVILTADLTTGLRLAGNEPYSLVTYSGAVAISGLPSSYTEVALTDGKVTRKFPWVPSATYGNIYNWHMLDDPVLLSAVDSATSKYSGEVTPGSWITLWTVGATHGNTDIPRPGADGQWPTEACANEYGKTRVVFSVDGRKWLGRINYCSTRQVNVLTPPDLPIGRSVDIQVQLNETLSNIRKFRVAEAQPRIFTVGAFGAIVHQDGSLVDESHPASPDEWLTGYASGLGPVDGEMPDGPAPYDRLFKCLNPVTILVNDTPAEVSFCGLAPGYSGLYQVNFKVPAVQADENPASKGATEAPLQLMVGELSANQVVLPVQ